MNEHEYKVELSKILAHMAAIFRDEINTQLVEMWYMILESEHVTIPELKAAAIEVMKSRKYTKLPTPAEILDVIRPRVDYRAIAEAQADEVLKAVRTVGQYSKPTFEDPITAVLMSTRWKWGPFASNLETEAVKWFRKDFVAAYQEAAEDGTVKRLPAPTDKPVSMADVRARLQLAEPEGGKAI